MAIRLQFVFGAKPKVIALALFVCFPLVVASQAQNELATRNQIRKTIDEAFARNVREGTTRVAPGIYAYTRLPLYMTDVAKITAFGDKAIPILSEYLNNPTIRFQELAVRCLGYIGPPDAIPPLESAAISAKNSVARFHAVLWLGSFPGSEADAALKRIADSSSDEVVRGKAAELLLQRAKEATPR